MISLNKKVKRVDNGGFRIAWFIPVECAMFGTMLALGPKFITGLAVILAVFMVPMFVFFMAFLSFELYSKRHYLIYLKVKRFRHNLRYTYANGPFAVKRIKPVFKEKNGISKPKILVLQSQK